MPWKSERLAPHIAAATPDFRPIKRWRVAVELLASIAALVAFWVVAVSYIVGFGD